MFEKIVKGVNAKKSSADNFDKFLQELNCGNMILTPWCGDSKCEDDVKAKVKAIAIEKKEEDTVGTCKTLNIPSEQHQIKEGTKCFFCGKDAKIEALWGRSY